MAVITYQDVATAIGRPIVEVDEQAQVTQWIADVEMLLGARLGDFADYDGTLLAYVIREAVITRMRQRSEDPDGEAADPASQSFAWILQPWWALFADEEGSTAYSIQVTSPLDVA